MDLLLAHLGQGPLPLHISPWLTFAYFGLFAPVQEETIFRGLLQTSLASELISAGWTGQVASVTAVLVAAFLFGAIHVAVGPLTAACALVLAVLAGELRRRSGSLLPAVLCHSLFNVAGQLADVLK